ncbi:hypothetical protein FRB91_009395 [Serendipita sp. 411]|nr:hypothetical protein FRB91_009395 [Serendipita sp. 411]
MSADPDFTDYVTSYAGLIFLATASIYTGSFASLPTPKKKKPDDDGYEEDEEPLISEELKLEDAYWFPIIGSVMLLSLYLIIKYISIRWINVFIQWYLSLAAVGSTWNALITFTRRCLGTSRWKGLNYLTLTLHHNQESILRLHYPTLTLSLVPLALFPSVVYLFFPKIMSELHTVLTDVMALSLSHSALASIKLDSLLTGVVLLSGLFIYDIWWVFGSKPVFGSSVMVTVAQGLDAPIKILFPKSKFLQSNQYTMLGLGDIVVPGFFIAFALRYDLHRSSHQDYQQPFAKPFFAATLVAYVSALILTVMVMHTFQSAQPALLYLSPACTLAFLAAGWSQGVWKDMWSYSDSNDSIEQQNKEKKD